MISIIAKCTVKKDKINEFKNIAKELVSKSQKEPGCISYDLCVDLKENNIFVFIEKWSDNTALDNHNSSFHFTELVPKLGFLQESKSDVTIYNTL